MHKPWLDTCAFLNHFLPASSGTTAEPIDIDTSDDFAAPDINVNTSHDERKQKKSRPKSTTTEVSPCPRI